MYINLSDFAVGEDVLLVVSAINRCEETSEGWSNTSVRVSVTNSNSKSKEATVNPEIFVVEIFL